VYSHKLWQAGAAHLHAGQQHVVERRPAARLGAPARHDVGLHLYFRVMNSIRHRNNGTLPSTCRLPFSFHRAKRAEGMRRLSHGWTNPSARQMPYNKRRSMRMSIACSSMLHYPGERRRRRVRRRLRLLHGREPWLAFFGSRLLRANSRLPCPVNVGMSPTKIGAAHCICAPALNKVVPTAGEDTAAKQRKKLLCVRRANVRLNIPGWNTTRGTLIAIRDAVAAILQL